MAENTRYNYYIKKEGEEEYRLIGENIEETRYTYGGLEAQTTYNIKVTATDKIGNEGQGTVDATTEEFIYQQGDVQFGDLVWENKEARVTITNNTNNTMEYLIGLKNEIDLQNGEWQTAEENPITVTGLKDDYRIIVRLTDGTNTTGYGTLEIEDTEPPVIQSVEGNSEEWTTENITLIVNAEDSKSGLQAEAYSFDGGETWQTENIKIYNENTAGIVIKVRDEAGNETTYPTIEITKIDKKGPIVNVQTETTTNAIRVNVEATDEGAGIEEPIQYTYYMTTDSSQLDSIQGETSTESSKEYTGLTENTTYYVKIEVEDRLGNKTEIRQTITTGSLNVSTGDLSISEETWANEEASVTITKQSEYMLEYQIVTSGNDLDAENNWIQTTQTEIEITGLLNGDKIYARLTDGTNASAIIEREIKDEKAPEISVTGNSEEWTKENITLEVTAIEQESGIQEEAYSFDGGRSWQQENTKTYTENTSGIVIQVRDKAGNIATYPTIEITKIDKEGPEITIETENILTKQVTVNVTALDNMSGMPTSPTYTYYIKQTGEGESEEIKVESPDTICTFENLKANTTYEIRVETVDNIGNVGEATTEITTRNLLYAQGNITFTETIWVNGKATVTATNNVEQYDMQYQIGKAGEKIDLNGEWETVEEKEIEIEGLEDGDIIYARITDGVNVTEGYGTCNIDNPAEEIYTEETMATNTTREEYDILGISVSGDEIRVQIEGEQEGAELYNYYYKTINDEEYKLISTNTYYNDPAIITDIEEGAIYKIKAVV